MTPTSTLAAVVIVDDPFTRVIVDAGTPQEREVRLWRLTLNVNGVAFTIADTVASDVIAAADIFAARLGRAVYNRSGQDA